jgi:glycosyltransferase involved in cell wall biosynthesis
MKPQVSFLVPCFNGERWLGEALASISRQTFTNFEAVVVNDGSTDNSGQIMENWVKQDPRFRIFHRPQSGLVDTLNFGLSECRGSWVARLDQDDYCENHRIERQLTSAINTDDTVLVGSSFYVVNQESSEKRLVIVKQSHRQLVSRLATLRSFFPHSSVFFNKDKVLSIGGYRSSFTGAEDWDLWLRLSDAGRITAVRDPLVTIRIHSNQMSIQDDGRPQVLDAHLAVTLYFLGKLGGKVFDPVKSASEFEKIKTETTTKLKRARAFELYGFFRLLQLEILGRNSFKSRVSRIQTAHQRKLLFKSISHLLHGSRLPRKIAISYLKEIRKLSVSQK